jgi:hypothetical protein
MDGKFMKFEFVNRIQNQFAEVLRVKPSGLPELPSGGYLSDQQVKAAANSKVLPSEIDSFLGEKYAHTRMTIRRNIYRVPITY